MTAAAWTTPPPDPADVEYERPDDADDVLAELHGETAGPRTGSQHSDEAHPGASPTVAGGTWQPVDLAPFLDGTHIRPQPTVGLARKDGMRLLYPGKEHTVIGEMESGKSWLALGCADAELTAGHRVVYIHFEEADPTDTVERLQLLGVPDQTILDLFVFVGPHEPVDAFALAALLDPAPSLVILDGVNEAMSLHTMGIRDEDGAAAFRRRLVKPCTAVGAATLACDHVVKDRDKRGRDPLGSIHKGNGLTGSLILLENAAPFGRGERGCSHVFITKDRPGYLRSRGRPNRKVPGKTFMGSLIVDDTRTWAPHSVDLAFIEPPDHDPADDTATEHTPQDKHDDAAVLATVAQLDAADQQPNLRNVRGTVRGNAGRISNDRIDDALARLVVDGRLTETTGPRNARVFTTVPPTVPEPTPPELPL
jgi:hypothetical protein